MRDSVKGFYACIYWKSGDSVVCNWCLTDRQTTEYSATQLVSSIKFKLSHAKNVCATNAQPPKSPIRVLSVSVQPPIREWFQAYQTIAHQSHSLPRRSVLGFPDFVVMQTVLHPWQNWCTTFQHHKILVSDVNEKIIFYGIPCCHAENSVRVFFPCWKCLSDPCRGSDLETAFWQWLSCCCCCWTCCWTWCWTT